MFSQFLNVCMWMSMPTTFHALHMKLNSACDEMKLTSMQAWAHLNAVEGLGACLSFFPSCTKSVLWSTKMFTQTKSRLVLNSCIALLKELVALINQSIKEAIPLQSFELVKRHSLPLWLQSQSAVSQLWTMWHKNKNIPAVEPFLWMAAHNSPPCCLFMMQKWTQCLWKKTPQFFSTNNSCWWLSAHAQNCKQCQPASDHCMTQWFLQELSQNTFQSPKLESMSLKHSCSVHDLQSVMTHSNVLSFQQRRRDLLSFKILTDLHSSNQHSLASSCIENQTQHSFWNAKHVWILTFVCPETYRNWHDWIFVVLLLNWEPFMFGNPFEKNPMNRNRLFECQMKRFLIRNPF